MASEADPRPPSQDGVSDHDVAADAGQHHGFRHWMAENSETLRVFLLIASYVSVMLYLVSLIALGGSTVVSNIFAAFAVCSALLAFQLFRLDGRVDKTGRTIWRVYRKPKTERAEKLIAILLWSFIVIGFLLALFVSRLRHHG